MAVAALDLDRIARTSDVGALLPQLGEAVSSAMYWQPPDEVDEALAAPLLHEVLLPVATSLLESPAARWWSCPLVLEGQQYVEWLGPAGSPPQLVGTRRRLEAWRASTIEDDRSAPSRPQDPAAPWTGSWWSTPRLHGVVSTTSVLESFGAVGLLLIEDHPGAYEASCWPLRAIRAPRIYEVAGAADWVRLVERFPLDVSLARRHDWYKVTGRAGDWLIPDWAGVSSSFDAIHLTVIGYLASAGRSLAVGDAASVLAGWNPDETFWLADVLDVHGEPRRWRRESDDSWAPLDPA
jgi:hypothetical protein